MEQDLCVAVGLETVSEGFELTPQFNVIKDLSVEHDPQRSVFVRHRLLPVGCIHDAQPGVTEAGVRVEIESKLIGASMAEHSQHLADLNFLDGFLRGKVDDARDTTHGSVRPQRRAATERRLFSRHQSGDRLD